MRRPEAPEASPDFDRWELGEPSLIRTLEARVVEPEQEERVERIVLDLELTSERRVRGIEFKPGDRRVVRGATFFVDGTGPMAGKLDTVARVRRPPWRRNLQPGRRSKGPRRDLLRDFR